MSAEGAGAAGDVSLPESGQSPLARQREKEAADAKAARPKLPNNLFPLGYKEGFSQWWSSVSPAIAEANVLQFIPFYSSTIRTTDSHHHKHHHHRKCHKKDEKEAEPLSEPAATVARLETDDDRVCASLEVPLSKPKQFLNEFSITRSSYEGNQSPNNLVIVHGYGAGLGFFYKNFDALSKRPGWSLFALDLLGMGRSARPSFKIKATEKMAKVREAEDFFVDSLEEWRKKRGLERFTLLGHSLGGYLAVCYALKYPGHIEKLILASPVGVPEDPYAVSSDIPDVNAVNAEFQAIQAEEAAHPPGTEPSAQPAVSGRSTPVQTGTVNPPPRRPLPGWLTYLWDANISPFSIVRMAGPLGPRLTSGWTSRRFSMLPAAEAEALHVYSYSLFRQRGSGEYALAYLLAPGAYARDPLIRRIDQVEKKVEMLFLYGENDWMDGKAGKAAVEKVNAEGGKAKIGTIKGAGHHVYLDGWEEFNDVVEGVQKAVEMEKAKQAVVEAGKSHD